MSLDVGLCMTVRNEASNIAACLGPIRDHFAKIVVIDTGSSDDTIEILHDELGIAPLRRSIGRTTNYSLAAFRNEGFDLLGTPWMMTLDADERISPAGLDRVIAMDDVDLSSGLFCKWDTHIPGQPPIEDYKLALFRQPHRHCGLIHDTAQPSLRAAGEAAQWLPDITLDHYPELSRLPAKRDIYFERVRRAIANEPDWHRYYWFRGYKYFNRGLIDQASADFELMHERRPASFPVESLNASMLLAAIRASQKETDDVRRIVLEAIAYHESVAEDFEVRVNYRLRPWFELANLAVEEGRLADIVPYRFPY